MRSIETILLQTLIVVRIPLWAEPVVLSAAPSGIAAREDQPLRTVPNATTRCVPGKPAAHLYWRSTDYSAGSWLPVAQSPVVAKGQSSLKQTPGLGSRFYRLRKE
jgi:hypothetical protein